MSLMEENPLDVAREGPGGIADQDVDLVGLQRREALGRGHGAKLGCGRIPEDRRRERPAEVDVETEVRAARIDIAEAGNRGVDPADHAAPIHHGRQARRLHHELYGDFNLHFHFLGLDHANFLGNDDRLGGLAGGQRQAEHGNSQQDASGSHGVSSIGALAGGR
jgi:hypothetical protein